MNDGVGPAVPRYGYRRIRIFLGRDGHRMGTDRTYRLWRAANLQAPPAAAPAPGGDTAESTVRDGGQPGLGLRLSLDACANGQQPKCLTVIDEYTREALAIDVAGSIRSGRVIEVLARWSVFTARPAR